MTGTRGVPRSRRWTVVLALAVVPWLAPIGAAERLYVSEGNNLRRIDLADPDRAPGASEIFIAHAERPSGGSGPSSMGDPRRRDINGMVCALPDGSGGFVAGEDTGQPGTPPGWGVFDRRGRQIGKLTATYQVELGDPYGCAFDADGRLFTTSVGNVGFGTPRGQLILWYPPYDRFPGEPGAWPDTATVSGGFCKLATDIGNAGAVAIDGEGRVYVASAGRGAIHRFWPPFPTGPTAAEGCGGLDAVGSPQVTTLRRDVFHRGLYTFAGLAFAPNGHLYASSVFTGEIIELAPDGTRLRHVLDPDGLLPPFDTGTPMGIAVDARGDLYYADLDLRWDFPSIGPGRDGKVRRIRLGEDGQPSAPEVVLDGLLFPDAVSILQGGGPATVP